MFSPILITVIFIAGILTGSVGVGGVLLAPGLKYLGGIPLHIAIPACMLSFLATGLIGTIIYARQGSIDWKSAIRLCIGALPGAYLGAFILPFLPTIGLEVTIGVLILGSGIYAIRASNQPLVNARLNQTELIFIGLVTGIGSSLTGTGGPLILLPILIWRKVPTLSAIGLSQAVQLPIALSATVGNLIYSEVDLKLAGILAIIMMVSTALGAKAAHQLPIHFMKKLVAYLLVLVGLAILTRIAFA